MSCCCRLEETHRQVESSPEDWAEVLKIFVTFLPFCLLKMCFIFRHVEDFEKRIPREEMKQLEVSLGLNIISQNTTFNLYINSMNQCPFDVLFFSFLVGHFHRH